MKRGRAASVPPRHTWHVSRHIVQLIGIFVVCVGAAAGLAYAAAQSRPKPVGQPAGPVLETGALPLDSYRGQVVLVSFLDTQAGATKAGDPSRAQVVFLKSMEQQHQTDGLRAVIVDAAGVVGKPEPSSQMLVNYGFDQALPSSIVVMGDQGGTVARAYAVTAVPTTLLIDQHGIVRQRWDRFASAAELDFAITPLLGPSAPSSGPPSSAQAR
jgi:hypothetical protein